MSHDEPGEPRHTPVLVDEVLELLQVKPGGLYIDCTLGEGGHSLAILTAAPDARLLGIDLDTNALAVARERLSAYSDNAVFAQGNFADLESTAKRHGHVGADGVLLDLGLSSLQVDTGSRGFSFRQEARLDMRFDPTQEFTADEVVNRYRERDLADVIGGADVVVDFSRADGAMHVMRTAAPAGVSVVIGTTGLSESDMEEAAALAGDHGVGIVIAPNFAVGAVLMMHLARQAARFFDYADLTEMHGEGKLDAPSGTAIAIARAAAAGREGAFTSPRAGKEIVAGTRGGAVDGVSIHSARMQGRVAHHDLVFGGLGQTLSIRHDSVSRESFMPGVMMAVREVVKRPGLTVGLDKIMGL